MFRNSPFGQTPTVKVIVGLGLCTLGGAMMYIYFKNRDDWDESNGQSKPKGTAARSKVLHKNQEQAAPTTNKERQIKKTLEISNQSIPLVMGRNGSNLSRIEEQTHTSIQFRDKNDTHKYCDITGCVSDVQEACQLLLKEVERAPIIKEEMYVPHRICSQPMLQEICRSSFAKVCTDPGRSAAMDKKLITIVGNRQQVNIARKMIEDKIEEEEELQRVVQEVEQKREPRRSPSNSVNSSMYSSQTSLNSHLLAAKMDDKPMEVYVSAVATPARFWVQLIGPQSKKLDDMVQEMTAYYKQKENRERHRIVEPFLGQIVAAAFKYDGKWYRAEVVGIVPNRHGIDDGVVLDLYFVDYGDSEYVSPKEVYELRTDFLTLRFQAVECFLANVKSPNIENPDLWPIEPIVKFEELTQVATWKKIIARVVTYNERPRSNAVGNSNREGQQQRENSQIPGIELYTCHDGVDTNIAHALISLGLALPADDVPVSMSRSTRGSSGPPSPIQSPTATASSLDNSISYVSDDHHNGNREDAIEDALITEQVQHLQENNNMYLNGSEDDGQAQSSVEPSPSIPVTPSADCIANGVKTVSDALSNGQSHATTATEALSNGNLLKR